MTDLIQVDAPSPSPPSPSILPPPGIPHEWPPSPLTNRFNGGQLGGGLPADGTGQTKIRDG